MYVSSIYNKITTRIQLCNSIYTMNGWSLHLFFSVLITHMKMHTIMLSKQMLAWYMYMYTSQRVQSHGYLCSIFIYKRKPVTCLQSTKKHNPSKTKQGTRLLDLHLPYTLLYRYVIIWTTLSNMSTFLY